MQFITKNILTDQSNLETSQLTLFFNTIESILNTLLEYLIVSISLTHQTLTSLAINPI